jgi:uncharacterized protein (TIGR00730 family)
MKLRFTRTNGPADEAIDSLMGLAGDIRHQDLVREMILAALKAGQETEIRGDLKLMNTTMKEMRFTTKIFGPYRNKRKVTVFGSARTAPDEPVYQMASLFGKKLAEKGFMVITGGGGGIMQAVNEGAGTEHSFGVNIRLPFEQQPNATLEGSPRLITYKYFFNRKVAFLKEAHAVALFPGGFGTLDEAMETLTLIQTGKHDLMPLVLIDEPNGTYWTSWMQFIREALLSQGYVSSADFHFINSVHSVDSAVECITRFYRRFHSQRYVDKKLVIRLSSPLAQDAVREIDEIFHEIIAPEGSIYLSGPLPAEEDEPELLDLPRLIIDFNRRDFGKLRALIDFINSY